MASRERGRGSGDPLGLYAFIPARSGSTRVPDKNTQTVGDRTLVQRAAAVGREAGCQVVVSTDSEAIWINACHAAPCALHKRLPHMANATAQIEDAIHHWMGSRHTVLADDDVVVLLQPTSPFRTAASVRACIELVRRGYDSALTINMGFRRNGRIRSHEDGALRVIWNAPNPLWRPRSQDVVQEPYENGAVYAFSAGHFRRTRCRMGGREAVVRMSQWEAFEIDTLEDLEVARALVGKVAA